MRLWLCVAAANGFIAVAMGALAAHGLEGQPWRSARLWIETGAEYEMAHALALLAVALLCGRATGAARRWLMVTGWAFLAGMVLFSGGLFTMGLGGLTGVGPVVPVGGLAYLIGWATLFYAGVRHFTGPPEDKEAADPDREKEGAERAS